MFAIAAVALLTQQALNNKELMTDTLKEGAPMGLVVFWSPKCASCPEEVEQVNQALKQANAQKKTLGAVGVPLLGRAADVRAFIKHVKPEFPQWALGRLDGDQSFCRIRCWGTRP